MAATLAVLSLGTGAVILPFISGMIIVGTSSALDTFGETKQMRKNLEDAKEELEKLGKSQHGKDFAVFVILNSYVKATKMVTDSLESGRSLLKSFVREGEKESAEVAKTISDIINIFRWESLRSSETKDALKDLISSLR